MQIKSSIQSGLRAALFCLLLGAVGSGRGRAQTPVPPPDASLPLPPAIAASPAPDGRLAASLDAILDAPALQSDFVGAYVARVRDNQVWYARNADRVFLPASNNKLLTSFAALQTLPPDFAYHTRIVTQGGIDENGHLRGDLILVGGGDPLLSLADLDALAQQVAASGVRDARGLRYDDKRYDRQWLGDGWTWDDEAASYSAQVSALNVNANCVSVQVLPGKRAGDAVRIAITPADAPVRVENRGVTGAVQSASSVLIDRMRGQNVITVTGTLPLAAALQTRPAVDVTIEDPARFTATLFGAALRRAGVHLHTRKILSDPDNPSSQGASTHTRLLAEHVSPTLPLLLSRMNKPSDNLMAECLLKAVGAFGDPPIGASTPDAPLSASADAASAPALPAAAQSTLRVGTSGPGGTGAQTARRAFGAAGLNLATLRQVDGSGLSRGDYVSPRNFVRLLIRAQSQSYFPVLYASLPVAGVDGTLRNRMKNTPAQANCHAKTGSLSHVSCLSGYVTTRDGDLLAFSLLMNNHLGPSRACTLAQDNIIALLAAYTTKTPQGAAVATP